IPRRADPVHRRGSRLHHARRRQTCLGGGRRRQPAVQARRHRGAALQRRSAEDRHLHGGRAPSVSRPPRRSRLRPSSTGAVAGLPVAGGGVKAMAEIERTRERERGTIPETPYEIFIRSRREFLERQETGQVVVKPSDREFYITRQGRLMYHLNPEIHKN